MASIALETVQPHSSMASIALETVQPYSPNMFTTATLTRMAIVQAASGLLDIQTDGSDVGVSFFPSFT